MLHLQENCYLETLFGVWEVYNTWREPSVSILLKGIANCLGPPGRIQFELLIGTESKTLH